MPDDKRLGSELEVPERVKLLVCHITLQLFQYVSQGKLIEGRHGRDLPNVSLFGHACWLAVADRTDGHLPPVLQACLSATSCWWPPNCACVC